MTVETFNASTTWVCPAGVTSVDAECWGGGGGSATGGGGGGGGAYVIKNSYAVTPASNYTVTVGAGGAAGSPGVQSSFDNAANIKAAGGFNGAGSLGGAGGLASDSSGDTKFSGGNGANGVAPNGGGGGSSAGSAANGNNGSGTTGGAAPTNGGAGGNAGVGINQPGVAGSAPGGAGGGPGSGGAAAAGATGRVQLTYTAFLALLPPQPEYSYVPAERAFAPIDGGAIATNCGNPVEVLIGFDCKRRNGNPIIFRNTLGTWPDLSHPAVRVTMYLQTRSDPVIVLGQVDIPVGTGAQVSFELASELMTQQIQAHHLSLYVKATMPDGTYCPLVLAGLRFCDPLEHDLRASFSGDVKDREFLIGCDYKHANGNSAVFTNTSGTWPSLVGAKTVLVLQGDGAPEEISGTVDVPFGVSAQVHFDVPSSITAAHQPQVLTAEGVPCRCYAKARLASGDLVPLGAGNLRWRGLIEPK